MRVPFRYHWRSLFRRKGATTLSLVAIALSVAVLVVMLALKNGFESSLAGTGRPDNLIVLRKGATSEGESGVGRAKAQILASLPGLARTANGLPLASPELYAAVNLERAGGGTTNVAFRGVSKIGRQVESTATIGEGRWFRPGTQEVVVGKSLLETLKGARLGGAIPFNGKDWRVVGILDSPGQAWNSEIWADVELLVREFDRQGYNSVILRVADPAQIDQITQRILGDPRLQMKVQTQPDYFQAQTGRLGTALGFVGWFLALIMAIGSAFGATNTLLASLQGRRREIGTLLALGFRPLAIYIGFLTEAAVLGLIGGALGVILALPIHGNALGTTNWATFTEQAFAFRVTPGIAITAIVFGSLVGLVGGTIPAWRASRLPPTEALRAL